MSLLACIGLFAAVVATWIAVSGPGEAALVGAGTIAARGDEAIAAVLAIAFFGTFAGSLAAYWIGRVGGRRLLLHRGPLRPRPSGHRAPTNVTYVPPAITGAFPASPQPPGQFAERVVSKPAGHRRHQTRYSPPPPPPPGPEKQLACRNVSAPGERVRMVCE